MTDPCPQLGGLFTSSYRCIQTDNWARKPSVFPLSASYNMDPFYSPTDSPQELQSPGFSQISNSSVSSPADQDSAPESIQDISKSPQCDAQIISVYLPDLFSSIMAVKPIVNPNYHEVKVKADSWITKYACLDHPLRWTLKPSK